MNEKDASLGVNMEPICIFGPPSGEMVDLAFTATDDADATVLAIAQASIEHGQLEQVFKLKYIQTRMHQGWSCPSDVCDWLWLLSAIHLQTV